MSTKALKVVNKDGKDLVYLKESASGSGAIVVFNKEGMGVAGMDGVDGVGAIVLANKEGKITVEMSATSLFGGGKIVVKNREGINGVIMEAFEGGMINVYDCIKKVRRVGIWGKADVGGSGMVAVYGNHQKNPVVVMRKSVVGGGGVITVANEGNKVAATMGADVDGTGYMFIHAKDGKTLVGMTSKDEGLRSNDGLIKVYNHKGEWRSISKD